jgi:hypothetical protein
MESISFPLEDRTSALAKELAQFADCPVRLIVSGGGYTEVEFGDESSSRTIDIEMNPEALARLRKADHADSIWQAIGYYRLVNRLHDATGEFESARNLGMANLFRILNDEHNERTVAATNKQVGAALQTLASYVYNKGGKPTKGLTDAKEGSGFESNPEYIKRLAEFAYRLRRRLSPCAKTPAEVVEALKLVPDNLKEVSKQRLLEIAQGIQAVLTRGIVLAEPKAAKKAKVVKPDSTPEPLIVELEDEPQEDEVALEDIVSPTDPRWWQLLFRSRWSYIVLGSFAMGWLIFLLKTGVQFWIAIATCIGIFAAGVGVFALLALCRHDGEGRCFGPTWSSIWAKLWSCSWFPFRLRFTGVWPTFSWRFSFKFSLKPIWEWLCKLQINLPFRLERKHSDVRLRDIPGLIWNAFIGRIVTPTVDFVVGCWKAFTNRVEQLCVSVRNWLEDVFKSKAMRHFTGGISRAWSGFVEWSQRLFALLWRHSTFRLFLLALPVAIMMALLWAMAQMGSELVLWQIISMGAAWLMCIGLVWLYSPKIKAWVIADVYSDNETIDETVDCKLPVDKETKTFVKITRFASVDSDPQFTSSAAGKAAEIAQPIRQALKRCGFVTAGRDNQDEGYDLVDELELAELTGDVRIFVGETSKPKTSLHIDVILDCSTSQNEATGLRKKGEKFLRSKVFALGIEEAVRGKRGVSAKFWGYDDGTIYECGGAGEHRVSGLSISGGGNNDAAVLHHVTQNVSSDKSRRVVILVSDAQPADCSWGALHEVGWNLIRQGVTVVQVLTEPCDDPALAWNTVDIHTQSLNNAATFLGRVLEANLAR